MINKVSQLQEYFLNSLNIYKKIKNNQNYYHNFKILFFIFLFINIIFLYFGKLYSINFHLFNPIWEDDFHLLTLKIKSTEQILKFFDSPRPIGYIIVGLTNNLPIKIHYLSYFLLSIFYQTLVFFIFSIFFKYQKDKLTIFVLICGLISCSFFEYFNMLRHLRAAGTFSSIFFYINLICLFNAVRTKNNFIYYSLIFISFLFVTLSIFSKEDFIIPFILNYFIFFLINQRQNKSFTNNILILASFFLLVFVWFYVNTYIYINPFIHDGAGVDENYLKSFNIFNIVFSYGVYLLYFNPTSYNTIFLILTLIFLIKKKKQVIKKIIYPIILIIIIIFPFSLLKQKFITEYIMQWFPIITSLLAFTIIEMTKIIKNKFKKGLFFFIFFLTYVASVLTSSRAINVTNNMLIKSSNYIRAIKDNQELIKKYNVTKIILNGDGSVPNPWYRQTGSWFQDQFNLSNKWYVFTQANSNLYKVKDDFHYQEQHNSKIKIYDINKIGNFRGLLIEFDDNGNIIKIIK
jgi:hypothetical protein